MKKKAEGSKREMNYGKANKDGSHWESHRIYNEFYFLVFLKIILPYSAFHSNSRKRKVKILPVWQTQTGKFLDKHKIF